LAHAPTTAGQPAGTPRKAAALGFSTALPPEGGVPVRVSSYARFTEQLEKEFVSSRLSFQIRASDF
jgi:hypothetical protein